MFKLRYSYGKVGNDNVGTRFPYVEKFGTWDEDGYYYGDIGTSNYYYTGLTYSRIASSSITWEVAKKHDLGLDFSMFNDKRFSLIRPAIAAVLPSSTSQCFRAS